MLRQFRAVWAFIAFSLLLLACTTDAPLPTGEQVDLSNRVLGYVDAQAIAAGRCDELMPGARPSFGDLDRQIVARFRKQIDEAVQIRRSVFVSRYKDKADELLSLEIEDGRAQLTSQLDITPVFCKGWHTPLQSRLSLTWPELKRKLESGQR